MVNEMKFYYKDYKNAIQIQGITPTYDIDFYFSSKKQYEQFKEDYEFSQPKKLKVQQALDMLPEYKKGYDAGRKEGAITFCKRVKGILKVGLEHNETLEGFEEAFIELEKELQGGEE